MNRTLYTTELKANARAISSYTFGMAFYLWLFIWIYPSFAKSQALNTLLGQMPQGLMKMLGYQVRMNHVTDFLGGEFYSLLYLVVMAIYTIFVATKLVAHLVDNGSMAYLLASPVSRARVAMTQAAVLLSGLVIIGGVTIVGGIVGVHWFIHHAGMDNLDFIKMNIVGMLLFCVVAAYCFLFSCLAPDERTALSWSATLTIVFYALKVIGDLSPRFAWVNHFSLFAVFNPQDLIRGQGDFAVTSICLAAAMVILLGIAVFGFNKRQLAL